MKFPWRSKRPASNNKDRSITPFPVELWLPILTEVIRYSFIQTTCVSTNMEEYHHMVTREITGTYNDLGYIDPELAVRTTLRLVCWQFNEMVKAIRKAPNQWLLVDNNTSITRDGLAWFTKRPYERIDLRWNLGHLTGTRFATDLLSYLGNTGYPRNIHVSYMPITMFRLHVSSTSQWSEPGVIRSANNIIQHPTKLQALHLHLESCSWADPVQFTQSLNAFTLLATLSLCLGADNLRDILYEPLSLPNVRVLFLEFTVCGARETALRKWEFPSLDILSLDLRIVRHEVDSLPVMPDVIVSFIERHGVHLNGLRLLPGPWSEPREDNNLLSMGLEAEQKFWGELPELKTLSTNFTHFSVTDPETNRHRKLPFLSSVLRLIQLGNNPISVLLQGLTRAIDACVSLQEIHITHIEPSQNAETMGSQDKQSLQRLKKVCSRKNIQLYYSH